MSECEKCKLEKTIIVYTKNNCMQCEMTKRLLKENGIEFEEVNFEIVPGVLEQLKEEGYQQAPVVKYGNFAFTGFSPDNINKLVELVKE